VVRAVLHELFRRAAQDPEDEGQVPPEHALVARRPLELAPPVRVCRAEPQRAALREPAQPRLVAPAEARRGLVGHVRAERGGDLLRVDAEHDFQQPRSGRDLDVQAAADFVQAVEEDVALELLGFPVLELQELL
jgi:hypothetical protein